MQSARWVCSVMTCCLAAIGCAQGTATHSDNPARADAGGGDADAGLVPLDASELRDLDARLPAIDDAATPSTDAAWSALDASDASPAIDAAAPACTLGHAFDEGLSYARELYVAGNGDDLQDGSSDRPLRTIRAASDRATPGTRVVVRGGSYPGVTLNAVQGEALKPIAFVADGEVFIEGATGVGWAMSSAAYVVIQGFTIQNAPIHGVNLDDGGDASMPSHHVVLRNLTVRNAGTGGNNDCVRLSGVDDLWVLGSKISNCNRGAGIDLIGCHRGVISKNQLRDTQNGGVQARGGSSDLLVHGNSFENVPGRAVSAGGATEPALFRPSDATHEAARIRVLANVFLRTGSSDGAAIAYVGCDGCVFAHNTLVEPRRFVARILQENTTARLVPSRNGLFVDNVVLIDTWQLTSAVNIGMGTAPESFTFGNNLWFAIDQTSYAGPVLDGGIPAEMGSLVQVDPRLVDRTNGNYRPLSTSPAIGAARALDFALPPDFDGRCYASPATLGAFAAP